MMMAGALLLGSVPARAQLTGVEFQETRGLTDAIGQRALAPALPEVRGLRLWSSLSYNHLDEGPRVRRHTDLYQPVIGADLWQGRVLLGAAAAASLSQASRSGFSSVSSYDSGPAEYLTRTTYISATGSDNTLRTAFSIAPYAAVSVTDAVHLSATVGYTHAEDRVRCCRSDFSIVTEYLGPGYSSLGLSRVSSSTDRFAGFRYNNNTNTVLADTAANLTVPVPGTAITLGGRLGYRFSNTWFQGASGGGDGYGSGTAYLGIGASYRIGHFHPYARMQWEYTNPTTGYYSVNGKVDRDALYLIGGLEYLVTDRLGVGLQALTQQLTPSVSNRQIAVALRHAF